MASPAGLHGWLQAQTWPDLRDRLTSDEVVAYRHPYGFIVCRLGLNRFDGWQIRVHLWPTLHEFLAESQMHDTESLQAHRHGWELLSHVVLGAVVESRYNATEEPGGHCSLYRVESDYAIGLSRLIRDSRRYRIELMSSSVRSRAAGVLQIQAADYHSTRPHSGPAVTVVASSTIHQNNSYVLGPAIRDQTIENARQEVNDLLGELGRFDELYRSECRGDDRWASFIFLARGDGKLLMVRPARSPELWQPIGGRMDARDADAKATAIREAEEEIGLRVSESELVPLGQVPRDVGAGSVYFWFLRLDHRPPLKLKKRELLEATWLEIAELSDLSTYAATKHFIPAVRELLLQPLPGR